MKEELERAKIPFRVMVLLMIRETGGLERKDMKAYKQYYKDRLPKKGRAIKDKSWRLMKDKLYREGLIKPCEIEENTTRLTERGHGELDYMLEKIKKQDRIMFQ